MDAVIAFDKLHFLKVLMLLMGLLFAGFIVIADWLYLVRTRSAAHLIDLDPPTKIDFLIKSSMFLAGMTIVLILLLLLFRLF